MLLVGDSQVGKSSMMETLLEKSTKSETTPASLLDANYKLGMYLGEIDNVISKFQVWDTASHESAINGMPGMMKGARCVFIVFDVTRQETFESAYGWLEQIRANARGDVLIYLVGNRAQGKR